MQVFDAELPGFGIRKFAPNKKFPHGKASYFVKYNVGSQQRRKTLGKVVKGNLKAMRLEASAILAKARLGTDVAAEAKAAALKVTVTIGDLVPRYLAAREAGDDSFKKLRAASLREITRYLAGTKDKKGKERTPPAFKALNKVAVDAITRANVVAAVDDLTRKSGKTTADRARAALSGLYAWAIERRYCETKPTMNVRQRAQNKARERVLSEVELVGCGRRAAMTTTDASCGS